jgi:hypothetical protein
MVCQGSRSTTNARKMCWWVALKSFFVYIKPGIINSLQQMANKHQTILKFEAYSMGNLANVIWGENWDVK